MTDQTPVGPLWFAFLTLPETENPVLNIQPRPNDEMQRYWLTRKQLYALNAQIADALLRGGKS
jgi:hypothetical protein